MLHESQGLALGLEPGDHLTCVHARLQDFQSHPAADRMLLLGHEDHAEAAFPDLLDQFVGSNQRAYALTERGIDGPLKARQRGIEERSLLVVDTQQCLDACCRSRSSPHAAWMNSWRASGAAICRAMSKTAASSSLSVAISFPWGEACRTIVRYPVRKTGLESPTSRILFSCERSGMAVTFGRIDFEAKPAAGIGPVAAGS